MPWRTTSTPTQRRGATDAALAIYRRARAIDPGFAPAWLGSGVILARQRKWSEARRALAQACRLAPRLAEAHAGLGTLLVLRRAAEGAERCFLRALEISPGYALARNGLGCARYGKAEWPEAIRDFAAAARELPLPVCVGNLRAVAVAHEHQLLPGRDASPLFRATDFLHWPALRELSEKRDEVIHSFLGRALPATLATTTLATLNEALANRAFSQLARKRLASAPLPERLRGALEACQAAGAQRGAFVLLNRRFLEHVYPHLIAPHDRREPGMQLTLTRGFQDALTHKKSLRADQLVMGQARMDQLWSPMARALETSKVPGLEYLGKSWNRHIEHSTRLNYKVMQEQRGIDMDTVRPSGVSADLARGFRDGGDWPVATWFGLLHSMPQGSGQATPRRGR